MVDVVTAAVKLGGWTLVSSTGMGPAVVAKVITAVGLDPDYLKLLVPSTLPIDGPVDTYRDLPR